LNSKSSKVRILFVCMGNICRSPTAQGVFDQLINAQGLGKIITTDSAGTGAWHTGKSPDSRARKVAKRRGYNLDKYRARMVNEQDYERFDLILAMDRENIASMQSQCPAEYQAKLKLLLSFSSATDELEVPDPYYGGQRGFELVLDLVEDACHGLISHLQNKYRLS